MVFTFILIIVSCIFAIFAENIITEIIAKETSLDPLRQVLWCPTFQIGTQCPDNSFIFFYKCCGHLHKQCCSHLRVWVPILIIALPLLCIVPPFVYLLRRFICKRQQGYSSGIQMTNRDCRDNQRTAKSFVAS